MDKRILPALRRAAIPAQISSVVAVVFILVLRLAQASGYEAWFSSDIGAVNAAGSAVYSQANDQFTVRGSGVGIGGSGDEAFFTYLFLRGQGSITAKILSVENTSSSAMGAVVIREGTQAGDRQVVFGTRPDGSLHLNVRSTPGGMAVATPVATGSFPRWVRLERAGNNFAYSSSTDGLTWTNHGSVNVSMDAVVRVGLLVSSADDGTLCSAVFQSVATAGNTDDIDLDGLSDAWEWQFFGGLMQGPVDDFDQDGLTNIQEFSLGAQPTNPDTDSDGISDGWEAINGLNPLANDAAGDADNDGLTNLQEFVLGTSPQSPDTDADGMPDKWEVDHGSNPRVNDASTDLDGDGLSNLLSYQLSSSALVRFKLDGGTGTSATDSSGRGNHGTLVNGPAWISGSTGGGALAFDGTNDYVSVPAVNVGNQFTVAMLVKLASPVRLTSRAGQLRQWCRD